MAETREVKAVLDLSLGPTGERAMKDLVQAMGKVSSAYERIQHSAEQAARAAANNKVIGPLTGSAADAAERARKAGGRKFMTAEERKEDDRIRERDNTRTGRLVAAAGAVRTGVQIAAAGAQAYGDPYLSEIGRSRAIAQEIPGGAWGLRMGEMLNNREGILTQSRVVGQIGSLDIQQRNALAGAEIQNAAPQAGREALASLNRQASGLYGQRYDRTTAEGERSFQEQRQLLPVRREMAKTTREYLAAVVETNRARETEQKLEERGKKLQTERIGRLKEQAKLEKQVEDGAGGFWRAITGEGGPSKEEMEGRIASSRQSVATTDEDIRGNAEQLQKAREARLAAEQRQGGLSARGAELRASLMETHAGILEERAATSAGSAQRLGGMNVYDRAFGVQAFKALQEHGPDALPPEMLAAAQQFAPKSAAKILETHGAGTAEFQEGMKLAPADYAGAPEELRQKAEDARREAETARMEAVKTITQVAADSGRDMGTFMVEAIRTYYDSMRRKVEQDLMIGRAHQ